MEDLLRVSSLAVSYNGKKVLSDLTFSLNPGEVLGIVGESGSGKSTILRAILGILGSGGAVTGGEILFSGSNLLGLDEKRMREIRGAGIGMIFQDAGASLCPVRRVGSQMWESMAAHGKITKAQARERALELLENLGFPEAERIWDSYPFELSGGMSQRVGAAMAMLLQPSLLLADEPTSALDVDARDQVLEELRRMRDRYHTAMLLVSHDFSVVSALADRVLVLREGRMVECGSRQQVLFSPAETYTKQMLAAVPPVLEARNLKKGYRRRQRKITAVEQVSLCLYPGEILGLMGPSGSGKSTVAKLLAGLAEADEGEIFLDGKKISCRKREQRKEIYRKMQMVFQSPAASFDPRRTLGDGIGESLRNAGISGKTLDERVKELLRSCGLSEEFVRRYPHEVSGGQCQRAAIARALAVNPKILICDEATSALDVMAQRQILELLASLRETRGISILFICHNPAVVEAFCDRFLVMEQGRVIREETIPTAAVP